MLHKFSSFIANILLADNAIEKEDIDIYIYGLEILISTASSVVVIFILSIFLNQIIGTILFLTSFLLLRRYIGGYHSNTYLGCFLTMIFIYLFSFFGILIIPEKLIFIISCILLFISIILVFIKAPQEHPNRPLSDSEYTKFKKISRITILTLSIVLIILFLLFPSISTFLLWPVLSLSVGSLTLLVKSPA